MISWPTRYPITRFKSRLKKTMSFAIREMPSKASMSWPVFEPKGVYLLHDGMCSYKRVTCSSLMNSETLFCSVVNGQQTKILISPRKYKKLKYFCFFTQAHKKANFVKWDVWLSHFTVDWDLIICWKEQFEMILGPFLNLNLFLGGGLCEPDADTVSRNARFMARLRDFPDNSVN